MCFWIVHRSHIIILNSKINLCNMTDKLYVMLIFVLYFFPIYFIFRWKLNPPASGKTRRQAWTLQVLPTTYISLHKLYQILLKAINFLQIRPSFLKLPQILSILSYDPKLSPNSLNSPQVPSKYLNSSKLITSTFPRISLIPSNFPKFHLHP